MKGWEKNVSNCFGKPTIADFTVNVMQFLFWYIKGYNGVTCMEANVKTVDTKKILLSIMDLIVFL